MRSEEPPRAGRLIGFLLLLATAAAPAADRSEAIVVMISFDGFRHDYFDRFNASHFQRVAREGARADGLIPVFPSKTFPNHLSIATGVRPGKHGIVDNVFYDRDRDKVFTLRDPDIVSDGTWYEAEPIWVAAELQGINTAAFFWVGSEAPIHGVQPKDWREYDENIPNAQRVDTVLEWLDRPEASRPRLIMLYFSAVDTAAHRHGALSDQVQDAVKHVNRMLGRLLDGIEARPAVRDRVHLILVSDHGMADVERYVTVPAPPIRPLRQFNRSAFVSMWFEDVSPLGRYAEQIRRDTGLEVITRGDYPDWTSLNGSHRAPDMLVLGTPGTGVVLEARHHDEAIAATHGYRPVDPIMHGIFLAWGPRIRSGKRIPAFENVHIYPLVAELLGIQPNPNIDGRGEVLHPILRAAP
ncbi:MAG: ectonucleotide pyrophosphatase/phosphodiesterase [Xanthomonadales bacterium]|nr:ectonucleotide pyrophosphatase/phosphodiesterase [Xanthomonadales bacterium]